VSEACGALRKIEASRHNPAAGRAKLAAIRVNSSMGE
jgi:hypothetical protein